MLFKAKFFLVATFLALFVLLMMYQSRPEHSKPERSVKYVLFWTKFWQSENFYIGFGFEPFSECEYKNCFATKNKSLMSVDEFDALLFHSHSYDEKHRELPAARRPNQVYVYVNGEPPTYTPYLAGLENFFNWTMSYRLDSDVVSRYNRIVRHEREYTLPTLEVVKNKTKMMAWFVSRCNTTSQREVLLKSIAEHISVDVYGKCGSLKCASSTPNECYDMLQKNYKFYFSAENSLCKDYTTEKLYHLLQRDVVPVVYGSGDYGTIAPPESVINVADFDNVSQLVDYLKFLDANPNEYLKYFEWKKHYRIMNTDRHCQICKMLNEPFKPQVIEDVNVWNWGPDKENCKLDNDLPKIVRNLL